MSLDEGISSLIKSVYCAGEDACAWDNIADRLLQLTGACAGLTTVVDLKNREFSSYRFYGPDNSSFARGIEEYSATYVEDPSLIWACKNPDARFCDSSKSTSGEDYISNPFVRWNRARFGATHWYVGFTQPDDELSFSFSVHFPAAQGPGTGDALTLFRMLFDHMECAVRLRRRPFNHDSSRALVILDAGACVRHLSRGAQQLFFSEGALSINQGKLVTACNLQQPLLDKAIARAFDTVSFGVTTQAIELYPANGRPWIIIIRPLLSSYGAFGQVRCELLVEIHAGLPRIGSLDLVQSLYNLTGREMQIVRLLADGHSIDSASEVMEISGNTARTHLRAVFSKTSTTRQSELMHLCAGLSQR